MLSEGIKNIRLFINHHKWVIKKAYLIFIKNNAFTSQNDKKMRR